MVEDCQSGHFHKTSLDKPKKQNQPFAHKGYWFQVRYREADEMRTVRAMISSGDSLVEVQLDRDAIERWIYNRSYNIFDIEGQEVAPLLQTTLNLFVLHREQHAAAGFR